MESQPLDLLSRERLASLPTHVDLPAPEVFSWPERILMFGTGAFLRAFAAFFVDQAHRNGSYAGRIAVVQSTGSRRARQFNQQDGLFTLHTEGYLEGREIRAFRINAAISRALSATDDWEQLLGFAARPELDAIISNTTEAGLLEEEANWPTNTPSTYTGRLCHLLYARYRVLGPEAGKLVVLPCELVVDNGRKLEANVRRLAAAAGWGEEFQQWMDAKLRFCNTLVDRIVTGTPPVDKHAELQQELGYRDELLTVAEPYRLWAIEGPATLREQLPFLQADPGIVVAEDITPFRELKLRLLNGAHSLSVGLGYLCGLKTVYDCMQDTVMSRYIRRVMEEEIAPTVPVDEAEAMAFAASVQDRFRNPFLHHQLLSISLQYTAKVRARILPSLERYLQQYGYLPGLMSLGFAAYLWFMRIERRTEGIWQAQHDGQWYDVHDDAAEFFYRLRELPEAQHLAAILENESLWGKNLRSLEGFPEAIAAHWQGFREKGVRGQLLATLAGSQRA